MKSLRLLAAMLNFSLAITLAMPAMATQERQASPEAVPSQTEDEPVIYVEAWRRDRALDAFLRGDFATAEVEFGKNLRCIRRIELALEASLRLGIVDSERAGVRREPPVTNLPQRAEEIAERTCYGKQWQHYMIGLSQIQLGRFDEAKESLYKVIRMSKDDLMFDAHYRVGLLELLDGDVDRADRQVAYLTRLQRSCRARGANGARCEINADLEVATAHLARAVADARHGALR